MVPAITTTPFEGSVIVSCGLVGSTAALPYRYLTTAIRTQALFNSNVTKANTPFFTFIAFFSSKHLNIHYFNHKS